LFYGIFIAVALQSRMICPSCGPVSVLKDQIDIPNQATVVHRRLHTRITISTAASIHATEPKNDV
jgi:hypothetical protein